jgi:hypothetical protein
MTATGLIGIPDVCASATQVGTGDAMARAGEGAWMRTSLRRRKQELVSAHELRRQFNELMAQADKEGALALIPELRQREPSDPRWPHKLGDLLRFCGRRTEASDAYLEAARLYADQGLPDRARAIAGLAASLSQPAPPEAQPSLAPAGVEPASKNWAPSHSGRRSPASVSFTHAPARSGRPVG